MPSIAPSLGGPSRLRFPVETGPTSFSSLSSPTEPEKSMLLAAWTQSWINVSAWNYRIMEEGTEDESEEVDGTVENITVVINRTVI